MVVAVVDTLGISIVAAVLVPSTCDRLVVLALAFTALVDDLRASPPSRPGLPDVRRLSDQPDTDHSRDKRRRT
jgi:hypothetical protein